MILSTKEWEQRFLEYFQTEQAHQDDASHDLSHFRRVAKTAAFIASLEQTPTDPLVLLAAAYFHDIITLPKNHPDNSMSSRYSAIKARKVLFEMDYPVEKIEAVCHAIETHSYSAQLHPETLEAKIIQDADRMESLGALGVMRTFYVSGRLQRDPYDAEDMKAENRPFDDKRYGLDHFSCKLYKLPDLLHTEGGKRIAKKRLEFLYLFANELISNVKEGRGGAYEITWACFFAGKNGHRLFHIQDPFAISRPREPDEFLVDRLLDIKEAYPQFLEMFIQHFAEEIKSKESL